MQARWALMLPLFMKMNPAVISTVEIPFRVASMGGRSCTVILTVSQHAVCHEEAEEQGKIGEGEKEEPPGAGVAARGPQESRRPPEEKGADGARRGPVPRAV